MSGELLIHGWHPLCRL